MRNEIIKIIDQAHAERNEILEMFWEKLEKIEKIIINKKCVCLKSLEKKSRQKV
jgi:hypothetical protein